MSERPAHRFWFKLAQSLGMSVARCQVEVNSAEFSEWLAFDQIDPIGKDRDDLRMGILASTIVSAAHPKSKCRPLDFMPDFDGSRNGKKYETKRQTVEEMQSRMMLASGVSAKKAKR